MASNNLYTLSQAAKKLGVCNATICEWANTGKIEFITLPGKGKRRRYRVDEIIGEDVKKKVRKKKELSTLGCPQGNNQKILKDKLPALEKNTQATKLLEISEAESITKEEVFYPWWTESLLEKSRKLWLPTKTDSVDSVTKYSNTSSTTSIRKSWFSITKSVPENKKWSKISFPSLQFFPAGQTVLESIKPKSETNLKHQRKKPIARKKKTVEDLYRTVIYRIWPTKEQKQELRRWFGACRYCYNATIDYYLKDKFIKMENEEPVLGLNIKIKENKDIVLDIKVDKNGNVVVGIKVKKKLQDDIALNINFLKEGNYDIRDKIISSLPFNTEGINLEVRREAVQDALVAINSGGNEFNYRSKKSKSESIAIRTACISTIKNSIFTETFGSFNLKGKNNINHPRKLFKPDLDMGGDLVRKGNKYYIHLTKLIQEGVDYNIFKQREFVCSLDPGTSTFQTYYSQNSFGKIAPEAGNEVLRHCLRIDKLNSKRDKASKNKKNNLNRAKKRAIEKLRNKITDLHWKTANYLCSSFDTIILPNFETKNMVKRATRKIKSKTARALLTLSHFTFSERLRSKAEEMSVSLIKVEEPFTSQVCGGCFYRNEKLKLRDRTYHCKNCSLEIDRDCNGSRNILLRTLSLTEYNILGRNYTMGGAPF